MRQLSKELARSPKAAHGRRKITTGLAPYYSHAANCFLRSLAPLLEFYNTEGSHLSIVLASLLKSQMSSNGIEATVHPAYLPDYRAFY